MSSDRPSINSVTTINADGSRRFLHPADTRGRWTFGRRVAAWGLIAVYILLPWIPVDGYPAVFLDIGERRFHFFGWTLPTQEAWLLFFLISGVGFALFFLTALLGRVWCGWACPQTVFLEHVFRRVERWIDGDAVARRQLDAAPWNTPKVLRRLLKHTVFAGLSAAIAHVFLAYFVSLPRLYGMMTAAPTEHWGLFVFMFVATGILYFDFAWFREQLCIVLCPYGRLQSALIDDHSLVIGYDVKRGEPRKNHGMPQFLGDCIDCARCVQVCPTGIDIRQGLQLECIGCTACIDACDAVMERVQKPRGLIRYDSLAGFGGGKTRWLRPRTLLYGALLLVGALVALTVFSRLKPSSFVPLRMPGGAYFLDAEAVRNQFLVRLTNKTTALRQFRLLVEQAPDGMITLGTDGLVEVAPMQEEVRSVIVRMPRPVYHGVFHFRLAARDETGGYTLAREVEFLGPDPKLLDEEFWREKPAH